MGTICAEEAVRCPANAVGALLQPAIARLSSGPNLDLRVPSEALGVGRGFTLEHAVRFRVERERDAANLNDVLAIHWQPEGTPRTVPDFHGTVDFIADADPARPRMTSSGASDVNWNASMSGNEAA